MNKSSLKSLMHSIDQNKGKFPALALVQQNPTEAAYMSKLIRDHDINTFNIGKKNADLNLNAGQMQAISDSVRARVKDNESVIQMFPDIELAIQIVVSSIISPKDMVKVALNYKTKEPIFPNELLSKMNTIVQEEMDTHYKLKEELPTIIREAKFEAGSYVNMTLPESIVDSVINDNVTASLENVVDIFDEGRRIRHVGILGNSNQGETDSKPKSALESFFNGGNLEGTYNPEIVFKHDEKKFSLENLEVSDNFQFLKMPKVVEVQNKQRLRSITKSFSKKKREFIQLSTESVKNNKRLSNGELSQILYKDTGREYEHMMVLPSTFNTKRKSVGRPLRMKMPSESCIPVYIPGSPNKKIGYFFMVEPEGNPVSRDSWRSETDGLQGLLSAQQNNQNMSSLLIDKAKKNIMATNEVPTLDNITEVYASIVENDLIERVNNGLHGAGAAIAKDLEIYRIMLARSLKGKMTRLIYVPAEYVTYYAFKYFQNGVGKSLLDDVKNLTSIRGIVLFSKLMAQVKSSINVTKANLKLDEHDPDPQKTIEMMQHEVAKMRQMYFPLGINSPVDLLDWLSRAGIEWTFSGHPAIPDTSITFETDNFKHEIPDSELDDELRKQTYMAFGLSPEVVDNGFNSEFATTANQNNILFSKRVSNDQDILCVHLTNDVCQVVRHDEVIRGRLMEAFVENKALLQGSLTDEEKQFFADNDHGMFEVMLDRYLDNLVVELPRPDVTTLTTQTMAFNEFEEAVEKAITFIVSEEVIPEDILGEFGGKADRIKSMYKAYLVRNWMAANNYLPELSDIITTDEEGKPRVNVADFQKEHVEALGRSFTGFLEMIRSFKTAVNKDIENMGADGEASMTSEFSNEPESPEEGTGTDGETSTTPDGEFKDDSGDLGSVTNFDGT